MKILWISDHPGLTNVGQARVTREICLRLSIQHDVHVLGFVSPLVEAPQEQFPYPVTNITRGDVGPIDKAMATGNFDCAIFSHDIWMFGFMPQLCQKYPDTKLIAFATIDGHPFNPRWSAIAYSCSGIFVPSKYGIKVLKDACPDVPAYYVPYGLSSDFYHRPSNERLRFGEYGINAPEFMAFFYGHNQSKKNIGNALLGWEKFAHGKKDVGFVLVTHTLSNKDGKRAARPGYDLALYTYIPGIHILDTVATDEQLALALSRSDALVFPSIGEGFGYPPLEAMACGCVPITTNFAAVTDFCNEDNSIMLDVTPFMGEFGVIRAIASPDDIAAALERRYAMRGTDMEREMIKNGYDTANSFTWAQTITTFNKSLASVMEISREEYASEYGELDDDTK